MMVVSDRAIDRIRVLHQPTEQEAEFWFDADGPSTYCEPSCTDGTCPGHSVKIQVCRECGYEHDGEIPVFRAWPCPTISALDEPLATSDYRRFLADPEIIQAWKDAPDQRAQQWFSLPKVMRDEVWDVYVPGQEDRMDPTEEYIEVTQRIIDWLARWKNQPMPDDDYEPATVEQWRAAYEAKVADFARETLRTSAALQACAERGIKSPRYILGEAGIGWDMAMEYVEHAIKSAQAPSTNADTI